MRFKRKYKYTQGLTITCKCIVWILLFSGIQTVYSQVASPVKVKTAFTYKLAQYIEWPNETSYTNYIFGILTTDKERVKVYKDYLSGRTLKGKAIKVVKINSLEEVKNVHILYVDEVNSLNAEKILKAINNRPVIMISDNAVDKRNVMINLYDGDRTIKFEINKANIISCSLKVDSRLILLGGTEMDVVSLYKDSQRDLEKEKVKVKDQQNDLEVLHLEIEEKKNAIEKQKEEIRIQQEDIDRQKSKLSVLNEEIIKQKKLMEKDEVILQKKGNEIKLYEAKIKKQEYEIEQKAKIVFIKTTELKQLALEASMQRKKVNEQKNILAQQSLYIKIQQNTLYFFIAFLLLVLILTFFIFRNYRAQKIFNQELAIKNEQIEKGVLLLEREKENTLNSIRYAKTIQKAILPRFDELSNMFESFVILRPRDIVSGDFLWFHLIDPGTQNEKCLVATIDCTGHGVPGAFMSMIGNTLLNEIVKERKIYDPGKILDYLDHNIRTLLKQNESENTDGMDACFCLVERDSGNEGVKVLFAGAKRPLYYSTPDNKKINMIKGDRRVVGGIQLNNHQPFTTTETILPKGTKLYLTTDGIFDQNNEQKIRLGKKHFETFLLNIVDSPIAKQKEMVERQLDEFMGKAPQRDDIALIGIMI
jgi:serine phosphatase RsbU (regulator of sigma subunit)